MSDAHLIQAALRTHLGSHTGLEHRAADPLARIVAARCYLGADGESYSFVSTGAIPDEPQRLWRQLEPEPEHTIPTERLALGYLATYLLRHAGRGPVPAWGTLWLRGGEYPVVSGRLPEGET
ncbi:hypothetical protein [Amycolatopsis sp. lyj-112]|uniref:hypothetical protein n=1 Tax=Amycolatopsis sp. lyj-112 TaxID=2789288 RepID=UPI00397C38E5